MELIAHERLKRMSAMISGAIAFYEMEGDEIIQGLRQQQKDGLVTGMETMGAALLVEAADGSLHQRSGRKRKGLNARQSIQTSTL